MKNRKNQKKSKIKNKKNKSYTEISNFFFGGYDGCFFILLRYFTKINQKYALAFSTTIMLHPVRMNCCTAITEMTVPMLRIFTAAARID